MSKTWKMALFTMAGIFLLSIMYGYTSMGIDKGSVGIMGATAFFVGLFAAFIAIILTCIKETRETGRGMLLGSGIAILIGFSVCTSNFTM